MLHAECASRSYPVPTSSRQVQCSSLYREIPCPGKARELPHPTLPSLCSHAGNRKGAACRVFGWSPRGTTAHQAPYENTSNRRTLRLLPRLTTPSLRPSREYVVPSNTSASPRGLSSRHTSRDDR